MSSTDVFDAVLNGGESVLDAIQRLLETEKQRAKLTETVFENQKPSALFLHHPIPYSSSSRRRRLLLPHSNLLLLLHRHLRRRVSHSRRHWRLLFHAPNAIRKDPTRAALLFVLLFSSLLPQPWKILGFSALETMRERVRNWRPGLKFLGLHFLASFTLSTFVARVCIQLWNFWVVYY